MNQGRQEGAKIAQIDIAKKMIKKGFSNEDIINVTGLSFDEIKNL